MSVATRSSTVAPGYTTLDDPLVTLQSRVIGQVITPISPDFDEARKLPYMTVVRRPHAIVRVATAEDVATTVDFAREHKLSLTVRGGGHSLAYFSTVDGGITVDLSSMNRVTVDPVSRTAKAQGGATSGDLAAVAQRHGLALTTGDTRSVGLGGLVTGGGVGFMVRKHGLTIDNLLSAQVVLADGRIVTA